ncbi:hypothetical protein fHeYen902_154 [Yersinia phage fHe-Yen9-02]|nr:hypothetical protein fHeYen902_154 [Yersinia phage fHe-Yen9-02]
MKKIKACIIDVTRSQMFSEKVTGQLRFKSILTASDFVFIRAVDLGVTFLASHVSFLTLPRQSGKRIKEYEFTFDLDLDIDRITAVDLARIGAGELDSSKVVHTFVVDASNRKLLPESTTHKQFLRPRDPFKYKGVTTHRFCAGATSPSNIPKSV